MYLDAKEGEKVFKEAKKAVEALEDFIEDTEGCDDAAQFIIDDLLAAHLMIVNTAMSEVVCDGTRKCDQELDKARKALAKADDHLAKGNPSNAINEYGKAWSDTQKAAKYAPSTEHHCRCVVTLWRSGPRKRKRPSNVFSRICAL